MMTSHDTAKLGEGPATNHDDDVISASFAEKKKKKKKKDNPPEPPASEAVKRDKISEPPSGGAAKCTPGSDAQEAERLDQYYRQLHGRLHDLLHPDGEAAEKERLKVPPPEVVRPGSRSATIVNFRAICQRVNRPVEHVATFLQTELGSSGSLDEEQRLRVKWANDKKVERLLRKYLRDYVACQACKSLSTAMVRGEHTRLQFVQCLDCRSERSVPPIQRGFVAVGRGDRRRARMDGAAAGGGGGGAGATAANACAAARAERPEDAMNEAGEAGEAMAAGEAAAGEAAPLIDEKQATLNVGIVGHVAHGKSSLVRALTGVKTQKHSEDQERNITIRLGYANCKIFACADECPPHLRYVARPSSCKGGAITHEGRPYSLVRQVSFVDCPGHESLMQNMLSGAAVMDGALLLVAANEPCPAPQTLEHLSAAECLGLRSVVAVQNKLDLVDADQALEHYEQVRDFIAGSVAAARGVTPICAQQGHNLCAVLEQLALLPEQDRDLAAPVRMLCVRSFDVNRPGTDGRDVRGGVAGGAVTRGVLRVGQEVEIRPGLLSRDGAGRVTCTPLRTVVETLHSELTPLDEARPGGLIGVGTRLDPLLTKEDRLTGQVLGAVGSLPPVLIQISVKPHLMRRVASAAPEKSPPAVKKGDEKKGADKKGAEKPSRLKEDERLLVSVGAGSCAGRVKRVEADGSVRIALDKPVCAERGELAALSRKGGESGDKWRLVGRGEIVGGEEAALLPPLLDEGLLDDGPTDASATSAAPSSASSAAPAAAPASAPAKQADGEIEKEIDNEIGKEIEPEIEKERREPSAAQGAEGAASCRMYEQRLPLAGELVAVQVSRIPEGNTGVYVELLEYDGAEGFIPGSEMTRKRKGHKAAAMSKLTRAGKQETCVVLTADAATGCVDLSKWRVSAEEAAECEGKYTRAKAVHAIVRAVSRQLGAPMEGVYQASAWRIAREAECEPYEAFCAALTQPDTIFNEQLTPGLAPPLREALLAQIKKRLAGGPPTKKVRAEAELRCVGGSGVAAIRRALAAGLWIGSEAQPISIKLVAPPLYSLATTARDAAAGVALLTTALDAMAEEAARHAGGALKVKTAPHAADESGVDTAGAELIARLKQAALESAGGPEPVVVE